MKKVSLIYTAVLLTGALSLVSCDRDDGDLTPKEGQEWQGEGYYSQGAIINPISDSSVKNAIEYKPFFKSGSSKDDSAERKQVSEFTVPSEVTMNGETYIVTKLADNAFQGCVNLTSVTLPNTITEIGLNAFYGCRKLSSITLPNSLELIGNTAFHGCIGLTSITIPENVKKLGYQMFFGCSNLKTVFLKCKTIPQMADALRNIYPNDDAIPEIVLAEGVEKIDDWAFYFYKLTSIALPESLTSIGKNAFCGTGLTSIVIPEGVTHIGYSAFNRCEDLESATVYCETLPPYVFDHCKSLKSISFYGKTINRQTNHWYDTDLVSLSEIHLGEGVETIAGGAFGGFKNLTSITLPESLTCIGDAAFSGSGLTSIVFPKGVKELGQQVFADCDSLQTAIVYCDTMDEVFANCRSIRSLTLFCKTLKSIGYNCDNLTEVEFGEGLERIGAFAFSEQMELTTIDLPSTLTSIDGDAFTFSKSLKDITCKATTPPVMSQPEFDLYDWQAFYDHVTIHVPAESVEVYKAAEGWSNFKNIVAM